MVNYTKQDELIVKDLLESLFAIHQKKHGSGSPSGGSSTGGSFFSEFLHGFTVPFKQLGGVFDLIKPGMGDFVRNAAESVDKMVPGKRYASIGDVFANKAIAGTGMGKKGKVGRPRKVYLEVPVTVVKRKPGRPRKVV
jgi:hypothetical protein